MIRKYSMFRPQMTAAKAACSPKTVVSVVSHEKLLAPTSRRRVLKVIKQQSRAPEKYFAALYEPLIQELSHFLQSLPDIHTARDNTHAIEIEWLDGALARAAHALIIRHRMRLPLNASDEQVAKAYPLFTYVVFSSALLWQIGKLCHYLIEICNQQGMIIKRWNPITGSLFALAKFYKLRDIQIDGSDVHQHITPVLARHIMPDPGFSWIAHNESAFEQWLAALVDEEGASGGILSILTISRMILDNHPELNAALEQLDLSEDTLEALKTDIEAMKALERELQEDPNLPPVSLTEPAETALGESFYEWLKSGLRNGSIAINGPHDHVHITKDGVILAYPEIFQDYAREFHRFKDWPVIFKQFNALGIAKKSGSDKWFDKFFVELPKQTNNYTFSSSSLFVQPKSTLMQNPKTRIKCTAIRAIDQNVREITGIQIKTNKLINPNQKHANFSNILKQNTKQASNPKGIYPKLPPKGPTHKNQR